MFYTLDHDLRVISKSKDEIVLDVDYNRVKICKGDEVYILQDFEPNENVYNRPDLLTVGFDFIYKNIKGEDDSGDYELTTELEILIGIGVNSYK